MRESFGNTQETRANQGSVCPWPMTVACGDVDNSPVDSNTEKLQCCGTCGRNVYAIARELHGSRSVVIVPFLM